MVDTWRSPKALNSAVRIAVDRDAERVGAVAVDLQRRLQARAAASRWSRRGTAGRRASAPAACSAQSFSSSACTLCRMYWYCALLGRPPSCRFWIGRMKTADARHLAQLAAQPLDHLLHRLAARRAASG